VEHLCNVFADIRKVSIHLQEMVEILVGVGPPISHVA